MNKFLMLVLSLALFAVSGAQAAPKKKFDPKESRKEIRVVARNTAAEIRAPLTPAELEIATRVQVGTLPCELGQTVVLTPEAASAGFFSLQMGKEIYRVTPEVTSTGAVRLEDKAAGVVWLQLSNKSMLMSQKFGRRLADECHSPAQAMVAEAMVKNPPPSLLEPLPIQAVAAVPSVAPATSAASPVALVLPASPTPSSPPAAADKVPAN
ncbi:MAG: hypothetical protein ABI343_22130 [Burkholderiaceae bacterium]